MIPDILVGQAVLHGIQNDGTQVGIASAGWVNGNQSFTGYGTFILTKVSSSHVFDMKEIRDETDFTAAMDAVNEGAEIEIDLTISSGVVGGAGAGTRTGAASLSIYPAPLQKITLSHLKTQGAFSTQTGAVAMKLFDGDFIYMGGAKIDQSQGDFAKLTGMKLKKFADSAQNASLTTQVVG